jgi:hypothetical protein
MKYVVKWIMCSHVYQEKECGIWNSRIKRVWREDKYHLCLFYCYHDGGRMNKREV